MFNKENWLELRQKQPGYANFVMEYERLEYENLLSGQKPELPPNFNAKIRNIHEILERKRILYNSGKELEKELSQLLNC